MASSAGVSSGLSGFFRAFSFVFKHNMAWMFLVPAVLWLVLFFGLYQVTVSATDSVGAWVAAYLEIPVETGELGWWAEVKAFINGAREMLVSIVLSLAIGYLLFIANKYIVLVVLSPLLAYASERTEEILTGKEFPFSFGQLMKDALRGALIAMRNGILELLISLAIWVATFFFPPLGLVSFILLFFVSAYFYGFSMFDYVYERRRMRIGETTRAVNSRMGAVLANGAMFSLLMKIPLIGLMLAPVMASVGAVLSTVEQEGTAVVPR
jgi:CysZ protein